MLTDDLASIRMCVKCMLLYTCVGATDMVKTRWTFQTLLKCNCLVKTVIVKITTSICGNLKENADNFFIWP